MKTEHEWKHAVYLINILEDALWAMHKKAQESCEVYFRQDGKPIDIWIDLADAYGESEMCEKVTNALIEVRNSRPRKQEGGYILTDKQKIIDPQFYHHEPENPNARKSGIKKERV